MEAVAPSRVACLENPQAHEAVWRGDVVIGDDVAHLDGERRRGAGLADESGAGRLCTPHVRRDVGPCGEVGRCLHDVREVGGGREAREGHREVFGAGIGFFLRDRQADEGGDIWQQVQPVFGDVQDAVVIGIRGGDRIRADDAEGGHEMFKRVCDREAEGLRCIWSEAV